MKSKFLPQYEDTRASLKAGQKFRGVKFRIVPRSGRFLERRAILFCDERPPVL